MRNGSVCHLAIGKGRIDAIVSDYSLYNITIEIKPLPAGKWKRLRDQCTGKIGAMLELRQGRFSDQVMAIVTDRDQGLFPGPGKISMSCSCPDWTDLCKHLAAALYGVGSRIDQELELLFLLRGIDHEELISADLDMTGPTEASSKRRRLATGDLSGLFGVEIDEAPEALPEPRKRRPARTKESDSQAKPVASSAGEFIPSSKAVTRLCRRFEMSMTQFARLAEAVSRRSLTGRRRAGN